MQILHVEVVLFDCSGDFLFPVDWKKKIFSLPIRGITSFEKCNKHQMLNYCPSSTHRTRHVTAEELCIFIILCLFSNALTLPLCHSIAHNLTF